MNENFVNDILNNEELKEKIMETQSEEEYLELLKEYFKPLKEDNNIQKSMVAEINDDNLDKVSGGANPFEVIYEHTFTVLFCPCGHHEHRQGYWLAMDVECPKCHKETLHGKHVYFA